MAYGGGKKDMILDCFMYAGEYSALQIRLNELDGLVDKFVIVEGTKTFRNKDKPLYLDYVWDYLKPWHDRIHRVVVEHYPITDDPWELEHFQRDQVLRGVEELQAAPDDILIVSDADEIPKAEVVKNLNVWSGVVHLDMNTYYFCVDWKVPDKWNQGGRPFVVVKEQMGSAQEMRDNSKRFVVNGGWHFSYLGSAHNSRWKIQSFAHSEYDIQEYTDLNHLKTCAQKGLDPFGRFELEPVNVDHTYPQWVQDNQEEIAYLFRQQQEGLYQ